MNTEANTLGIESQAQDLLHKLDVGMIILDPNCTVCFWNRFMVLYSGQSRQNAEGSCLFDLFPELPAKWLKKKINSVFLLKTNAFITWEQRQFLFEFRHNRPITGGTEFMAQNITIMPIKSDNKVTHVAISIFDVTDVFMSKMQLQEANRKLEEISQTDALTGIYNRGHLEFLLKQEYSRAQRNSEPLSLIMLDIDHFKKVNDSKGHLAGDAVIRSVAETVKNNLRAHDVLGRYGGEEFCIFLPATNLNGALICAEKLRKAVEEMVVIFDSKEIKVTSSFGVSVRDETIVSYEKLINAADTALYLSKSKGRNAVSNMFEDDALQTPHYAK